MIASIPWRHVLPGIAAVLALWAAYSGGVDAERSKWQARELIAVAAAQAESAAMQAQVDAAGVALSEQAAAIDRLAHVQKLNTRTFYVQNPAANVACLHPDRLRAIQAGDDAANAAITAR